VADNCKFEPSDEHERARTNVESICIVEAALIALRRDPMSRLIGGCTVLFPASAHVSVAIPPRVPEEVAQAGVSTALPPGTAAHFATPISIIDPGA
jgi:hypothetical protein